MNDQQAATRLNRDGLADRGGIFAYSPRLTITNIEALPRGTGARFLECIKGQEGVLIAKAWRRSEPQAYEVLVDFA